MIVRIENPVALRSVGLSSSWLTTLVQEPASMLTLLAILVISLGLDFGWARIRDGGAAA